MSQYWLENGAPYWCLISHNIDSEWGSLPDVFGVLILIPEWAHLMLRSVIILIQEWAHLWWLSVLILISEWALLMIQCHNIDSGIDFLIPDVFSVTNIDSRNQLTLQNVFSVLILVSEIGSYDAFGVPILITNYWVRYYPCIHPYSLTIFFRRIGNASERQY